MADLHRVTRGIKAKFARGAKFQTPRRACKFPANVSKNVVLTKCSKIVRGGVLTAENFYPPNLELKPWCAVFWSNACWCFRCCLDPMSVFIITHVAYSLQRKSCPFVFLFRYPAKRSPKIQPSLESSISSHGGAPAENAFSLFLQPKERVYKWLQMPFCVFHQLEGREGGLNL